MALTSVNDQVRTNGTNGAANLSDTQQLLNKTAVVTGASRGIGAGIAILLGKSGANVIVNYTSTKSQERAQEVVKVIQGCGSGPVATAVQADVTTDAGQQSLLNAALSISTDGKIDILVHNAGDGEDCYLKDISEEFYRKQTDLNVKAPIFLTKKAIDHMPAGGRIIIISSISARMGVPQQTIYAATKAANEAMVRVWATELGQSRGVTVNCVNPGPVATDGYYDSDQDFIDSLKPMIETTPAAARIGEVEDIAPIVRFLASEESRWITGQAISVSGGLLFH